MIDAFVHENVSLVKSLGSKSLDDLEKIITRGLADGKRAATIGAEIQKRWGIAERHARLIARDQIGKLNGQLTRVRHAELGIAEFRWLTMNDPLVRPTHKTKEGRVFAYKGPDAPPFFPGEEVCCRCGEEPLFDDILGLLDSMMADATPAQPAAAVDTSGLESVRAPAVPVLPGLAEEVLADHARAEAARAAAVAAAKEDLVAFNAHTANEKAWAAKVDAAKAKQTKALEDLKAKMAAELAAKKAQEEAAKAAHEAAQKAALAAQQAAELAAKKAAAAAKAKATRAANKAKKAAAAIAPAPAPTAAAPGAIRYASIHPDHFGGFHGRGFVQDADAIEGGSVRVVKVRGHDGAEYFEAVFKVTSPFGDKARAYGTEAQSDWAFRQRELRNGVLHDLAHTESMPNASRSAAELEPATRSRSEPPARSPTRSACARRVWPSSIPRWATSPSTSASTSPRSRSAELELQAKARLAAKFDPKTFGSSMQSVTTPEQHRQVIEDVFAAAAQRHPVMLEALKDVRVEEVYPGHKTLYSEALGKHLGKQWKAMYHDGNPPAELAAKIVGDTGLMSSVKRYNSGVFTTGMSTSADFRTGGADGVFMRVAKTTPSSAGGRFRAVIDTTKVMGRMDWWAFNHDNFGRAGYREYQQRWPVPEQTAPTSRANASNEVMATHGVPPSAFKKFIVQRRRLSAARPRRAAQDGRDADQRQAIDEFVTSR
jgi:SPP1 gp7 family putative phage head morphogenesis protein